MFRVSIVVFAITACYPLFIYNMDCVPVVNDQMIAWKVLLQHGVQWFDYCMIHSLVINKDYKALLRDTTKFRKQYLTEQLDLKTGVIWHRYGAMCGKIALKSDGLHRYRFYLQKYGWQHQPVGVYNSGFDSCLPHRPAPFFNDHSDFCFYAYGQRRDSNEKSGNVVEYMWRSSKRPWDLMLNRKRCETNIKNKKGTLIELAIFLEFPALLKAFLKSHTGYEREIDWWIHGCDVAKVYAIEGVTIPKNYKYHKQYFSTTTYTSFDDLPKAIRKAIVARYKAQCKNS